MKIDWSSYKTYMQINCMASTIAKEIFTDFKRDGMMTSRGLLKKQDENHL